MIVDIRRVEILTPVEMPEKIGGLPESVKLWHLKLPMVYLC